MTILIWKYEEKENLELSTWFIFEVDANESNLVSVDFNYFGSIIIKN